MTKRERREREAFAKLDALFAQLPSVQCKGQCTIACGAIPITELEATRLHQATHIKPRTLPLIVDGRQLQRCVYLSEQGRCKVYAVRPLICRVWGTLKTLSCPHGCLPDRWLTDREFVELGAAVERISGGSLALETCFAGIARRKEPSFQQLLLVSHHVNARSDRALAEDAERTRGLRAIFGGRIIAAIDHTRD